MPTYDYECRNCGNRVEVLHGVNDSGPTSCTVCGGPMRKLLSSPAIVFKGSGWAKKDRSTKPASSTRSDDSKAADGKGADGKGAEEAKSSDARADTATTGKSGGESTTSTTSTGGGGKAD